MTKSCVQWSLHVLWKSEYKVVHVQWRYQAIQNRGAEIFHLDNVYITHGILGYLQTIDLLCKSASLVHVPRGDQIKLWSASWIANQLTWARISGSSYSHGVGMEFLLSVTIVRIPFIELGYLSPCTILCWRRILAIASCTTLTEGPPTSKIQNILLVLCFHRIIYDIMIVCKLGNFNDCKTCHI